MRNFRSTEHQSGPARPVLMLDFDGTVCVGDDPVLAYVTAMGPLEPAARADLNADLNAFLRGGTDRAEDPAMAGVEDGYAAAKHLAQRHGLTTAQIDAAYQTSRAEASSWLANVRAPDGLRALLDDVTGRVSRVLVTNAPATGLDLVLDRLGITDCIDDIVTDAGKPERTGAVVTELLARHGISHVPHLLMSIGDVWRNDLAAPLELGCATAYIDRFDRGLGPAHLRGVRFEDLVDGIREWAADPTAFTESRQIGSSGSVPIATHAATASDVSRLPIQ